MTTIYAAHRWRTNASTMLARLIAEEITPVGFKADGKVQWSES